MVPVQHFGQGRAAAIALEYLVHRQPCLRELLRLMVEDVLTAVRTGVIFVALMFRHAEADGLGIVDFGERHRDLADLAQHRQAIVVEALALLRLFPRLLRPPPDRVCGIAGRLIRLRLH